MMMPSGFRVRAWLKAFWMPAGVPWPSIVFSVQPMAARDGGVGYDQLHHFIASSAWNPAPLEKALLTEADRMVGGAQAGLIIDDTALPKKGERSVGVAPQTTEPARRRVCIQYVRLVLKDKGLHTVPGLFDRAYEYIAEHY